jgi:DNA-binding NarL/FixJ family response regulator
MKRVILTESIQTVLEKDRSFFSRSGIKSVIALTNEEILLHHKNEKADLIITNLDMPGMSGEELCSVIRCDESLCKVSILIACAENAENLQRCTECGANGFISSPVNSAVLLQESYQLLNITPRKACRIPLKIKMDGELRGKAFSAHTENISSSGMLIESAATLFEGDTITFSCYLPGPGRVSANAEIVRVLKNETGKNQYGVTFIDISDDDTSALEGFIGSASGNLNPVS